MQQTKEVIATNIFCFRFLYNNRLSLHCFLSETIQNLWRAQWGLEAKLFLHSSQSGGGVGQPKPE